VWRAVRWQTAARPLSSARAQFILLTCALRLLPSARASGDRTGMRSRALLPPSLLAAVRGCSLQRGGGCIRRSLVSLLFCHSRFRSLASCACGVCVCCMAVRSFSSLPSYPIFFACANSSHRAPAMSVVIPPVSSLPFPVVRRFFLSPAFRVGAGGANDCARAALAAAARAGV